MTELLDPDDWSREIYTVAKDYFSPLAALTRNFVSHVQMGDKRQKILGATIGRALSKQLHLKILKI